MNIKNWLKEKLNRQFRRENHIDEELKGKYTRRDSNHCVNFNSDGHEDKSLPIKNEKSKSMVPFYKIVLKFS